MHFNYDCQETKESLLSRPQNNLFSSVKPNSKDNTKEENQSFISEKYNIFTFNRKINFRKNLERYSQSERRLLEGYKKDDLTQFLENYEYNAYDIIINISDLMAMSSNITSPYERLQDVYSRRKPDSRNSSFFKVCFINNMNRIICSIKNNKEDFKLLNINELRSEEELEDLLVKTSNDFMETYNRVVNHEDSMTL